MTNEFLKIVSEIEQYVTEQTDTALLALATVVFVRGSAYRRPGAQMLIYADGKRLGSVSGGCLEADVVTRAKEVMETGIAEYVLYDAKSSNGDLVFELGCGGAIGILIERATYSALLSHLRSLSALMQKRKRGVIATIYQSEGTAENFTGKRLILEESGQLTKGGIDPNTEAKILFDAREVLGNGKRRNTTYSLSQGKIEVLFEPIVPPISLMICGAGQDAVPLAQFASQLGWSVTVLDPRANYLTEERFPNAHALIETEPEKVLAHLSFDEQTAVVLMTHAYSQDFTLLQHLLSLQLPYLGLLGPKRRAERLLSELREDGFHFDAECLRSLYSPAGLDIGSETPEEIALAILAEVKAALTLRPGTSLRLRGGAIHEENRVYEPYTFPSLPSARTGCVLSG